MSDATLGAILDQTLESLHDVAVIEAPSPSSENQGHEDTELRQAFAKMIQRLSELPTQKVEDLSSEDLDEADNDQEEQYLDLLNRVSNLESRYHHMPSNELVGELMEEFDDTDLDGSVAFIVSEAGTVGSDLKPRDAGMIPGLPLQWNLAGTPELVAGLEFASAEVTAGGATPSDDPEDVGAGFRLAIAGESASNMRNANMNMYSSSGIPTIEVVPNEGSQVRISTNANNAFGVDDLGCYVADLSGDIPAIYTGAYTEVLNAPHVPGSNDYAPGDHGHELNLRSTGTNTPDYSGLEATVGATVEWGIIWEETTSPAVLIANISDTASIGAGPRNSVPHSDHVHALALVSSGGLAFNAADPKELGIDFSGNAGRIFMENPANTWSGLNPGAEGSCLVINAGLPAWVPFAHGLLSSDHDDTAAAAVSAGSLIYGNSTPAWDELVVGTNGQVLTVSGGYPAWSDLATAVQALLDDGSIKLRCDASTPTQVTDGVGTGDLYDVFKVSGSTLQNLVA